MSPADDVDHAGEETDHGGDPAPRYAPGDGPTPRAERSAARRARALRLDAAEPVVMTPALALVLADLVRAALARRREDPAA